MCTIDWDLFFGIGCGIVNATSIGNVTDTVSGNETGTGFPVGKV